MLSVNQTHSPTTIPCDIAVAGGGLGGLTAALVAAEQGSSVVLVEAGERLGGTTIPSGGGMHIQGASSWEEYHKVCPTTDPVLGKVLVERFLDYVKWLESIGAPGSYSPRTLRGRTLLQYRIGRNIRPAARIRFFAHLRQRLEGLGGQVLLGARAQRLLREDGRVAGLVVQTPRGEVTLRAPAVVLATGGFQCSGEMLSRYMGADPSRFVPRAVRQNVGDGLRMALEVGAAHSPSMDTVYGHLLPAPPCVVRWENELDPTLLSAFYAEFGIVVNALGERFVDEGEGEMYGLTINAAIKQPLGGLWVVLDSRIRRRFAIYTLPPDALRPHPRWLGLAKHLRLSRAWGRVSVAFDSMGLARDRGAIIEQAGTLEGLAEKLARHGLNPERLLTTIGEYNAAVSGDAALGIKIPKTRSAHKLEAPPFYAVKVAVGVSMTYGGVAIDQGARVLDRSGKPVRGLFAVPGTAGGIHNLRYGGALAVCGVFGMVAGQSASAAGP